MIGIIAILAAMLLPALNKARDKARAIECSGRLKEIISACHYYAGDYNDNIPCIVGNSRYWTKVLTDKSGTDFEDKINEYQDYLPPKILRCPSDIGKEFNPLRSVYGMWRPDHGSKASEETTAANLGNFVNYIDDWHFYYRLNKMKTPGSTVLLADSLRRDVQCGVSMFWAYSHAWAPVVADPSLIYARHGNRANIGYGDGHVSSMSPLQLLGLPIKYTSYDINQKIVD